MAAVHRPDLLIGCYTAETGGTGTGVTVRAAGDPSPAGECRLASPSWLTAHPWLPVVYAASETTDGSVTALGVDDGALSVLGSRETGGGDPCHLAISADGRFLMAANYSGGSVAVFGVEPSGAIGLRTDLVQHRGSGPVIDRQQTAHPHMLVFDGPRVIVVVDLGADALYGYRIEDDGRLSVLSRTDLPPGTGPRQLVPAGDRWLLAAELSAELLTLTGSALEGFSVTDAVAASDRPGPTFPAQLTVTPDGSRALLSNRGPDTVAVFDLTGSAPRLIAETDVGPGWPRHFCLVGDEVLVALQEGNRVRRFELDVTTGRLLDRGGWATGSPTCLLPLTGPPQPTGPPGGSTD
jgi:6-phosphogluconolactonase (cycloisomerase 2 family)